MENLLKQTIDDMEFEGKDPSDIVFIGTRSQSHSCTWDEYRNLANFEYNPDYGAVAVMNELVIVFNDGAIMERQEYDGSEWWRYIPPFVLDPRLEPSGLLSLKELS